MAGIYTWLRIIFVLISSLVLAGECAAQETSEYEPTSIALKISQIGVVDVGVYIKDQALYLPVTGLFSFLKIQNTPSPGYDSVTGFFINKQAEYVIDRALNRIQYQGKVYDVKPGDLIRTETNLYLRSEYFGVVFGLQCVFDFYSLSAVLTTNNELPVIREMRIEMMRRNISRLKDDLKADTIIRRKYPLFHFGMADWAFVNTQKISGGNDISMNLALGSVIAGGEANLTLNYSNNRPFTAKQQYYLWHYANNSSSLLRQVRLGKIAVQSTSSIFSSLVGVQFTNTPTTFRRSFGTYTLSDRTEPGWIVELYVNTVLVDYQKADASGFFSFEVPLVYGSSSILLRFYGPWGEERSRQQDINIPFNFLPRRKLEYNATIAMVEDSRNSIFSRLILNYGLSNRITVGIGAEYLSSIAGRNMIPFLSYSLRLASNLLISGEYAYDTRFKSIISYTLPMNLHVELNYTSFRKNQRVVVANFLEDRKLVISMPIHKSHLSSLIRLTLDQMFFQQSKNYSGELLFTGSAYGISANITTL
ncbi:MAG: hypothetical protein WCK34_17955, partial [Bacteroidota bacterium]